ncbi:SMI1/KNR4 family protein [Phenylobacterium sp.]|uniref:SMI1/KNR4 family protein n=1 Tax=Phenylobacterium sp. TaxID=1871053 RepID=UPI00271EE236|nr:SMI1/KNR4 family protein [Phenylobacterium sp.]MDO8379894.1 SMI1/KNR4 family protein [Phenylobacterium sp.]
MTIENLIRVVPPPAAPDEAYLGPWEAIEADLGTPLPQDYKDFVRLYGCGDFMEFLGIHVPVFWSPYVRLQSEVRVICDTLRDIQDRPYPLWPEPGGLLPFGKTDFGDYLLWLPRGPPDAWGVVVWDRGMGEFEAFDCGLTDFLAGLATGDIEPKEFPEDMLPCDRLFEPSPPCPAEHLNWRSDFLTGSFGGKTDVRVELGPQPVGDRPRVTLSPVSWRASWRVSHNRRAPR